MVILEVSEGQKRGEFGLRIKDEFVLPLVLMLEHHLSSEYQSFWWSLPAAPLLANLCFVCM